MTEPVRVRRASQADVPALADMTVAIQRLHHQAMPYLFAPVSEDHSGFVAYAAAYMESGTVYVAEMAGQAVGCVLYQIHTVAESIFLQPHTRLQVDQIGVLPACQRLGVGQQLMARVLADAQAQRVDVITLNVYGFNAAAIRFYEKLGFERRNMTMQRLV